MTQAEHRGRGIAAFVHAYDDLKAERDALAEQLLQLTVTYTAEEVSEYLHDHGYESQQFEWLADVLTDYAWHHPDWFRNGRMTVEGAKHIRFTDEGVVFTAAGREAMLHQYVK